MNTRQLQYAIMLSKVRNFSQVAEKLGITQPALSKQIANLENDLGVKLFDRNSVPVRLTAAGEYFIREAEELVYREDQLLRSMERYSSGEAGVLVIGITPFRSSYMIASVVKAVKARFPGIQIRLREAGVDVLRQEASEGKYDFAVVNLPVEDPLLEVMPLEPDKLVLAVPRELEHLVPKLEGAEQIGIEDCQGLPFVVVGRNQEMRILFDRLCAAAGFHPNIAVEVVGLTTAWSIARSGAAATILPWQFCSGDAGDHGMRLVPIRDGMATRRPAIVMRKDQHMTEAARYAIGLLTK